jgi:hypothetical protein
VGVDGTRRRVAPARFEPRQKKSGPQLRAALARRWNQIPGGYRVTVKIVFTLLGLPLPVLTLMISR